MQYIDPFGSDPYGNIAEQMKTQLAQIEDMRQKAMQGMKPGFDPAFTQLIRSEIDNYMQGRQTAPDVPQPMQDIISAVEKNMRPGDAQFVANNISALPKFFGTREGQDILQMLVEGLQKMSGVNSGENTAAAVAAPPGPAT